MANVQGSSADKETPGVAGENSTGTGVLGTAQSGTGVIGTSDGGVGVWGHSNSSSGTGGVSETGIGVHGVSPVGPGVRGDSKTGDGVVGTGRRGVVGSSPDFQGVYGHSDTNAGVVGESQDFDGVFGISHNPAHAGVSGHNPTGLAGYFDGDVVVTRDIRVAGDIRIAGADCAENFDAVEQVAAPPGTVMVLDDTGGLRAGDSDYDRRVAGVVSGADGFRPAVIMDSRPGGDGAGRVPVALVGKVYCKVDGTHVPIAVGDLLTTSRTPGHAMKAEDAGRAFGAVLGKALAPCADRGLIPILVTLQ